MAVRFEKGKNYNIPNLAIVKAKQYNSGKVEITYTSHKSNNLAKYKRKSANEYIDTKTNKIKQYEKTSSIKSDKALRRTLNNRVRPLLENNFNGGNNQKFITLTFDVAPEFEHLERIFTNFWNRLCRYYSKQGLMLACVWVKEIQVKRDVWHIHVLIKEINNKNLFIAWKTLHKIWGLGTVWVNSIISMYDYTSYQIDIEKEMNTLPFANTYSINKVIDYMCKLKSKKDVIPSKGRVYGVKGNLKQPREIIDTYKSIYERNLTQHTLINENTLLVVDMNTDNIFNSIHREIWHGPRPNSEDK